MDAVSASRERFLADAGDAPVRHVRVPRSSMQARTVKQGVSPALRARPLSVQFPSIDATVADLVDALSASNIQIAFRWQTAKAEELLKRKLPFPRYAGTVGGLLDALRTGLGIVAWQEGQTIFLSDAERYAVAMPQNEDILKNVAETLKSLGATEVVTSLDGGKVIYSSTPSLQDEIIGPFMHRTSRNLSTITSRSPSSRSRSTTRAARASTGPSSGSTSTAAATPWRTPGGPGRRPRPTPGPGRARTPGRARAPTTGPSTTPSTTTSAARSSAPTPSTTCWTPSRPCSAAGRGASRRRTSSSRAR